MNINELINDILRATTGPELRRAIIDALKALNLIVGGGNCHG